MAIGAAQFAVSPSGSLVYQAQRDRSRVAWLDRTGREFDAIDAPGDYLGLRVPSSGRTVLVSRALPSTGAYDIWSLDLDRGTQTRLTLDDTLTEIGPLLLSDGVTMIFSAARGGPPTHARPQESRDGA